MRKLIIMLLLIPFITFAQTNYYVAPDGNDSNAGTFAQPWGTMNKAFATADAGDTVFFRGGVYYSLSPSYVNPENLPAAVGNSGTSDAPIVYMGYPPDIADGNRPIIDCILHCSETPGRSYNSALTIWYVEHLKIKDIDVRNVFQCDSTVSGAINAAYSRNLTFEHIVMHDIGQRGYYCKRIH
jgi:hypothetical protein